MTFERRNNIIRTTHAITPRVAGFKSESPAGFELECMAGFVGIRSMILNAVARAGVEFVADGSGVQLNPEKIGRPSIWIIECGNLWADETREFAGLTKSDALEQRTFGFNGLATKYLEATFEQKVFIESLGDGTADWLHHLVSVATSLRDYLSPNSKTSTLESD